VKRQLTVIHAGWRRGPVLGLRSPFLFYFFYNLIKEIIKKFVGVLVHGGTKELVDFLQLVDESAWRDGALLRGVCRNVDEQGTESREEAWG
jgi:hypothetical protein